MAGLGPRATGAAMTVTVTRTQARHHDGPESDSDPTRERIGAAGKQDVAPNPQRGGAIRTRKLRKLSRYGMIWRVASNRLQVSHRSASEVVAPAPHD